MRDVNTLVITGRIGSDAEFQITQSGHPVLRFPLANSRSRYNEQHQQWETVNTTWYRVSYWGKDAEELQHEFLKGKRACVIGRVEAQEWETKQGEARKDITITADSLSLIPAGKKRQNTGGGSGWASQQQQGAGFGDHGQPPF